MDNIKKFNKIKFCKKYELSIEGENVSVDGAKEIIVAADDWLPSPYEDAEYEAITNITNNIEINTPNVRSIFLNSIASLRLVHIRQTVLSTLSYQWCQANGSIGNYSRKIFFHHNEHDILYDCEKINKRFPTLKMKVYLTPLEEGYKQIIFSLNKNGVSIQERKEFRIISKHFHNDYHPRISPRYLKDAVEWTQAGVQLRIKNIVEKHFEWEQHTIKEVWCSSNFLSTTIILEETSDIRDISDEYEREFQISNEIEDFLNLYFVECGIKCNIITPKTFAEYPYSFYKEVRIM